MTETFESRFGFHPCDYATFVKLKRVHKGYHEALRKVAAHRRWARKMPHNRNGPEPAVSAVYRELHACPEVVAEFHDARRPQPEADLVQPLRLSCERLQGWYYALKALDEPSPG